MISGRLVPSALLLSVFACGTAVLCRDATRETSAITALQGTTTKVQLRSTERLPGAAGEAKVERKGGTTEVEVRLDAMKPASLFGGDYNTYVLWVVPPGGRAENLGELQLDSDRATLAASTEATSFALLVTAEPHFMVSTPSAFVVLENRAAPQSRAVRYQLLEGVYNFERSRLDDVKPAKGKVHTEVKQAFIAVRLAQRAGAVHLAPEELNEAQRALDETFDLSRRRVDRMEIAAQAHETIRLALAAQRLAEDRAFLGARVQMEGSGGGKGEAGRPDPRGQQ
jgi:hypothetical protein